MKINRHDRVHRNDNAATSKVNKRPVFVRAIIVLAVAVAALIGFWQWKSYCLAVAKSDFQKLKGKWVRPDGGYMLEIKQVADDGKINASYLNPQSINVSQAVASLQQGQIMVFVELRDQFYPGNYYTLTYDTVTDQLAGVYHHLGIGQDFDVIFLRMR
jgi:hypothetical protein